MTQLIYYLDSIIKVLIRVDGYVRLICTIIVCILRLNYNARSWLIKASLAYGGKLVMNIPTVSPNTPTTGPRLEYLFIVLSGTL